MLTIKGNLLSVADVLAFLREEMNCASNEEVFVEAFKNSGLSDAHLEYRMFKTAGSLYLPACVQHEFLKRLPCADGS